MTAPELLRVAIIDDEPLAIERLQILMSEMSGVMCVAQTRRASEAFDLIRESKPDVCLLDIAMPELTGMEIARQVSRFAHPPAIIFVTAFDTFAVSAFDTGAVDFVVKPVEPERLMRAFDRARRYYGQSLVQTEYLDDFWVFEHQSLRRIAAKDIERITAERDYMRLHAGSRSWLINDSLARLEKDLDPRMFVRLHRSAIVNRRIITGLQHDESGWTALLKGGVRQKVGRAYTPVVREIRKGMPASSA